MPFGFVEYGGSLWERAAPYIKGGDLIPKILIVKGDKNVRESKNRGDPAAFDFTVIGFTCDGAWHDMNLSTIVPAGATLVAMRLLIKDDVVGSRITFRRRGDTNEYNVSDFFILTANQSQGHDMIVRCDGDRRIQYKASAVAWISISLCVKGWWVP